MMIARPKNYLILFVTISIPTAACKSVKQASQSKAQTEMVSQYQACDADASSSPDHENQLKLDDSHHSKTCQIVTGTEVVGKLNRDKLSEQESKSLAHIEKYIYQAYEIAVRDGDIKEGYKWITNWWQGLNEICELAVGTSFGATSGYKCIDKQGAIVSKSQDLCRTQKFCLPPNFRVVEVSYSRSWLKQHHFLAILVERMDPERKRRVLFYLGNIDPWGRPNDPTLHHSDYDILDQYYASYYQCGQNRLQMCRD